METKDGQGDREMEMKMEMKLKTVTKLMATDAMKLKMKLATKCFVQGSPKALAALLTGTRLG